MDLSNGGLHVEATLNNRIQDDAELPLLGSNTKHLISMEVIWWTFSAPVRSREDKERLSWLHWQIPYLRSLLSAALPSLTICFTKLQSVPELVTTMKTGGFKGGNPTSYEIVQQRKIASVDKIPDH
jgi:hypothetical protein